jgi:uncharacterized protein with PQ loop repeat
MEYTAITNELFGQIILNTSFVMYSFQFVPQIIHNYKNKDALSNISLLTQFGIFITVLCDIIRTVGFGYDWQYAAVAIFYLSGVCAQYLQISFYYKKMPEIVNLAFIILFALAMIAMGSNSMYIYKIVGYLGFIVNITYWFPQIYKNYKQKRADGFSLLFILFALIGTFLYLLSSLVFSWDLIFSLNSLIMLPIILILLAQKLYYKSI